MKKDIKIFDRIFTVNGLKAEIAKVEDFFWRYTHADQYQIELSGIIEKPEEQRKTELITLFNKNEMRNKPDFDQKITALFATLPNEIKISDVANIQKEAREFFNDHVCIIDNRKTLEKIQEQNIQCKKWDEENKIKREEQEKTIGLAGEGTIKKEENQMFITIEAYFDDSDSMTDYFCRHSSLSHEYAIGVVNSKIKREDTARNILNQIPELKKLNWEWNVEEYSMGHGTYLESEAIGTIQKKAYNGREEVGYWFEISFNKYSKELPKSKYFVDNSNNSPSVPTTETKTEKSNTEREIRRNEERNGIEIKFTSKPNDETLTKLKNNGFRWSKFSKVWYTKFSPDKLKWIEENI